MTGGRKRSTAGWQAPPITSVDPGCEAALRARIDGKAKPPGSLGRIEDLAVQLGMIWHPLEPRADRVVLFVFAGDHGLTKEGVARYPSSVTAAMVATLLVGRASANAFSAAVGADLRVVDAGVAADLAAHPNLTPAKVRHGTRNAAREPALTPEETRDALDRGAALVMKSIEQGADAIAIGEMGIGNTASAALIMHRLAGVPLDSCVGQGAGQDEAGLVRKYAALERAARRTDAAEPFDVLAEFGGCEIAMMAGAILGAASRRRPVLVDGFIATAAALVAVRLQSATRAYCIFAHRSAERGHTMLLQVLEAEPLLSLGMRLGEGTGALLAVPLVRAATRLMTDVASLDDVLAGRI